MVYGAGMLRVLIISCIPCVTFHTDILNALLGVGHSLLSLYYVLLLQQLDIAHPSSYTSLSIFKCTSSSVIFVVSMAFSSVISSTSWSTYLDNGYNYNIYYYYFKVAIWIWSRNSLHQEPEIYSSSIACAGAPARLHDRCPAEKWANYDDLNGVWFDVPSIISCTN